MGKPRRQSRYHALIESLFLDMYREGESAFEFARPEIEVKATDLGIVLPKNLGDLLYSFRYRSALPAKILETQPDGKEWITTLGLKEFAEQYQEELNATYWVLFGAYRKCYNNTVTTITRKNANQWKVTRIDTPI